MSVPTWSGDEHTFGNFRYRVLWFRVLLIAGVSVGLTVSFGAGYKVGQRAESATASRTGHRAAPQRTEGEGPQGSRSGSSGPGGEARGTAQAPEVLEFDDEQSSPPISVADKRTLLEEARALTAEDRARLAAEEARNATIETRLEAQKISLNFDMTPFAEGIDFLRDITRLNYVVSRGAQELVQNEDLTISLRLKDISLRNAVNLILASHEDLAWRIQEGVILIQTIEETPEDLVLEVYVVGDIVAGTTREGGGFALDAEVLIELLESNAEEEGSIEYQEGTLIVRKPTAGHLRVRDLLGYLRGAKRVTRGEPAWVKTYRQLLASRRVTLNFPETPFGEVMSFLQDITGLNITIGSGVDAEETTITLRLKDVLLQDALKLILEQADLGMTFKDETLLIAERDQARGEYALEILDVRDLMTWLEPDTIEELVVNGVGEDRWDDPALIIVHRGQLILHQTTSDRAAVENLLSKLRVSRAKSVAELESKKR